MEMTIALPCTEGTRQDDVKHGLWTLRFDSGKKWQEGRFVDDRKAGDWTIWHENGNLASRGAYVNGLRQGRWAFFQEDGAPLGEYEYSAGKLVRRVG